MGALRTCYLILPTFLATISFVLLLITLLDQISSTGLLSTLYFVKLDTSGLTLPTASTEAAVVSSVVTSTIADEYTIGLWNFCSTAKNGTFSCSKPEAGYSFNPLTAWGLSDSTADQVEALLPSTWDSALATYRAVSKWMFAAYVAAVILSVITILTGLLACALSRASACCTALLAWLAALMAIGASGTATAMFIVVKGIIEDKLSTYGLKAEIGRKLLVYSWIGSAFALAAAVAWMFGCCCSGAQREKKSHRSRHGKNGDDYEPLVGPYHGHRKQPSAAEGYAMPMQQQRQWPGQASYGQTAYEPVYGHDRV